MRKFRMLWPAGYTAGWIDCGGEAVPEAKNDLLVGRREALDLTQEELAQRLNAQLEAATGTVGDADGDYISKLERGVIRRPHPHTRRALRAVLGAETDAELGFRGSGRKGATVGDSPRTANGGDDVKRRAFMRAVTGSVAGIAMSDPLAIFDIRKPSASGNQRVVPDDIRQIREISQFFSRRDHLFGGSAYAQGAQAQLEEHAQLRHASMTDGLRTDLYAALGELADTVAGICFDSGHHRAAERCFQFAVGCAVDAGDWSMRAKALSGLANLAVHEQNPELALTHAESALVRLDLVPPVVRSMVHSRHARALGAMGQRRERDCVAAIRRSEDVFAVETGDEPEWARYYDESRLKRDCGRARLNLALQGGEYAEVRAQLAASVDSFPDGHSRGRSLALANLAALTMAREDPREAAALGTTVLESVGSVRSVRVFQALEQLRVAGVPHTRHNEVRELNKRITELLPQPRNGKRS